MIVTTKFKHTEAGTIPEEWTVTALRDVCSKIGSGFTPAGGEKVYTQSGVALIRSQNVYNSSFKSNGLAHIDDDTAKDMEGVSVESGDVLLNITGDSVARCCTVPESVLPARVNQHVAIIRTKGDRLNPNFLRYYMTSPRMQAFMLSLAESGGTRNALTKGMIERFLIPEPSLKEQRAIVQILSTLDSKIQANEQMNKTLEAMGHAIFKHWFIDFEFPSEEGKPYKSSGREMIYNEELGREIPKDWNVAKLADFVSLERGLSYKGEGLAESGLPMVNLGTIAPFKGFIYDGLKFYRGEYKERNLIRPGDLAIANTDITQKRDVLGSPAIVPPDLNSDKILFTHHIYAVRNGSELPNVFIYYLLQQRDYRERVRGFATGTTVLALPEDAILHYALAVPERRVLTQFAELVRAINERTDGAVIENRSLARVRDSLLPKLMSGKIRVPLGAE